MSAPRRRRRAAAVAALAAGATLLLGGCSGATQVTPESTIGTAGTSGTPTTGGTTPGSTPAGTESAKGLVWVVSRRALADVAEDPKALAVLEQGTIYELVSAGQAPLPGVAATVTEDFADYTTMAAAVQGGDLVSGAGALLYDPEHWSLTPVAEQLAVATYLGEAVSLAHAHGLKIVVTPALDLVDALAVARRRGTKVAEFLASGILAAAAGADVVDVQAQSLERLPTDYRAFVVAAATRVHAARAGTVVIAGLSTNPSSGPVTAAELAAAIESVSGVAQGFWLNMPVGGAACPGCSSDPDPTAGTGALDSVFG